MSEIDPVILQLRADVDRYLRDLRRAQGDSDRRLRDLENSFRRSSDGISASLKGIAGTLAAGFTGNELIGLIDQFTRFQNSLKVAGLEGERLAQVQDRLFATGARYGVSVNALADLYGKAEQAGRDLGASQSEILKITDAVAQALLVSGVSTEQASGAILGLSQALSGTKVQAEEFNQINEGGLRILLEAAAAGDRYNGSVGKFRQAVVDGKVSSQEFFRSILANTELIEGRANKATLTLSGSLQALRDSLARYVGEAAQTNGVTGALTQGIQALAENLDRIIPALATIAAIMAGRFAAGLAAAAFNAAALRVVALGLAVQLNGVAAAATLAGRALLTAMGGPVGVAIGAVAIGLTLVATSADNAADSSKNLGKESATTADAINKLNNILDSDPSAKVAKDAAELARQRREQAKATYEAAAAEIAMRRILAQNRLVDLQDGTVTETVNNGRGGTSTREVSFSNRALALQRRQAEVLVEQADRDQAALDAARRNAERQIANPPAPRPTAPASTDKPKGTRERKGSTGPTAAEIEARFLDELAAVQSRILSADGQRATSAEERAAFERKQLELVEASELRRLAADEELEPVQKARLFLRLSELANAEREAIAFRERVDLERQQLDLLEERGRAEIDALRLQFDLADTERERRRIALQILDAEQRLALAREEEVLQSETASKQAKELAALRKAAILAQGGAERASTERQFESPLARFARNAKDTDTLVAEAAVRRIEELNQTITDAMTDALGIKDPFLSQLIKIFLDRNVFGPLAEALDSGGAGGGGGGLGAAIGSLFGSLFGRSSGGRVSAGSIYRVNEGASPGRVEAFRPDVNGQIIPLGRMNAVAAGGGGSGGGVVKVVIEEAPGFAARVRTEATGVAVEVTRQAAPQIVDAAANETLRRANRPSL